MTALAVATLHSAGARSRSKRLALPIRYKVGHMNKSELIEAVAEKAELPKAAAARAVDALLATVTEALQEGQQVNLIGFGSFLVRERAARTARDPRTREEIQIKATKVPVFKAGKGLKDAVK